MENWQRGLKFVNAKPAEVFIRNKSQLLRYVNIFQDISEYLSLLERMRTPKDKSFVAVRYCQTDPKKFFIIVNLGHKTFRRYIATACDEAGANGTRE